MLNITFYKNSAERNRVDKTGFLSIGYFVQGVWRESTSIIYPEVLIEGSAPVTLEFNYCYIRDFKRYYYINDIIIEANGLRRYILSVDVLMSFKTQLFATECFISRNEFNYTNLLPDNKLPILSGSNLLKLYPIIGDGLIRTYQALGNDNPNITDLCVVVQVGGIIPSSSVPPIPLPYTQYYPSNVNNFNMTYIMSIDQFAEFVATISTENFMSNLNWLFENPADALVSFKVIPAALTTLNYLTYFKSNTPCVFLDDTINVGGKGTPITLSTQFLRVNNSVPIETTIGTFEQKIIADNDRLAFMRYSPYCDIQLYLPYFGFTDIDANLYTSDDGTFTLKVKYLIDVATGGCSVLLQKKSGSNWFTVQTLEFDISIDIPIGQTNNAEVARNQLLTTIKIGSSMIKTAAKFSSMSNELSISKGAASNSEVAAKSFEINREEYKSKSIEMLANNASDYTVSTVLAGQLKYEGGKINTSICKGYDITGDNYSALCQCALFIKLPRVNTNLLTGYDHLVGRPCQMVDSLSNLYGYTEVSGVHLENFSNATPNELDEIETSLKNGVLLPEPPSN